jgi:hypothetical protein
MDKYYGLQWTKQSCWIDSSLMALFFPERSYHYFYPFIQKGKNTSLKVQLINIINGLRTPNKLIDIGKLRSMLHDRIKTRTQELAFQSENKYGYVYYFIDEFLKLFCVPPLVGKPYPESDNKRIHILEIDNCHSGTITDCLNTSYSHWSWDVRSLNYLIIELVSDQVTPQLHMTWQGVQWTLCAMIVFNCSHFMTYVLVDKKWYIYDDNKSLHNIPLIPMKFGDTYDVGFCSFKYGENNTFFFYMPINKDNN